MQCAVSFLLVFRHYVAIIQTLFGDIYKIKFVVSYAIYGRLPKKIAFSTARNLKFSPIFSRTFPLIYSSIS
ncbi:hypothetical protein BKK50_00935 [Rodentibacter rarus]|uniref:Uncharacterized protein n=1 Tax=Rodentibacter rarus TaxID=1908260 RepID=A0A1V3IST8_9PAST|nr:hypothetical protein BKK50_00935 [Rodentibacter rarus]